MRYKDFLNTYVYYELSSKVYEYDGTIEPGTDWLDRFVEVDGGEFAIHANILSTKLEWTLEGRYKARRDLPRSKYRKLCKRVDKRFRKLLKRYNGK